MLLNRRSIAGAIVASTLLGACPGHNAPAAEKQVQALPSQPVLARPERLPKVLPENVGLDEGGKYGHWGPKGEAEWTDNRWAFTDTGPFFSSSLNTPGGLAKKAISIRIGDNGEAGVCFDSEALTMRAGWTGGFIEINPRRYGLIEMPRARGPFAFASPNGPAWGTASGHYRGLYLNGNRVVLSYMIDQTKILEAPWIERAGDLVVFTRTLEHGSSAVPQMLKLVALDAATGLIKTIDGVQAGILEKGDKVTVTCITGDAPPQLRLCTETCIALNLPPHEGVVRSKIFIWAGNKAELPRFIALVKSLAPPTDLASLCQPGPLRWKQVLATEGEVSKRSDPYVIDHITVPYKNPYNALMFLSGFDFFENGKAAVCTLFGDVWIVGGIDATLRQLTWQRFATGLFQPLGLKIVDNRVHVLGRDQITVLHDLNGDGEADFYENRYNGIKTSAGGHDYVTCLETDDAGNFYYVDTWGVHQISKNLAAEKVLATGFRNPNGMSVGPDGTITVAPQEGEWTPASQLCEVKPGGYYGYPGPKITAERPLGYDSPLCWIPRHVDNSTGGQVWVTSDRWGPLQGQLLNLSFGKCSTMLVLRERVAGQPQGGVIALSGRFPSGLTRGRFSPHDGQLYLTGHMGWTTSAVRDGSFSRMRYTGQKVYLPISLNVFSTGIRITFTQPLDRKLAEDIDSYGIQQWNYRWSASYGSKEYSVSQPDVTGHDPVEITSARLSEDARSLFLLIPELRPVMQMEIKYNLKASDGQLVRGSIYNTINRLGPTFANTAKEGSL